MVLVGGLLLYVGGGGGGGTILSHTGTVVMMMKKGGVQNEFNLVKIQLFFSSSDNAYFDLYNCW